MEIPKPDLVAHFEERGKEVMRLTEILVREAVYSGLSRLQIMAAVRSAEETLKAVGLVD